MRALRFSVLFGLFMALSAMTSWAQSGKPLQIYFVDVEGGQATLFVTPEKQSLLIDTGWDDNNGRDADRIVAAARQAGLSRIDYVLITHYHEDHVGGAPQLAANIPIETFIDHGELREHGKPMDQNYADYQALFAHGKTKRLTVKAGDHLPIRGMNAVVVSADGRVIDHALPGGGEQNQYCTSSEVRAADETENARSVGVVITFGKVKIVDLGDLTWDKERELMCPVNRIGQVDIYVVSHHGWMQSGSPALVDAIAPRVAIMDNGAKKGGSPGPWQAIESSPGLKNLWQLHYSEEGGKEHNVADGFIANVGGTDEGNYLKVTAYPDGAIDVYNSRTKSDKTYASH